MRCKKVRRELSAFIDGEVSSKLKREIEEHLHQCADCFREYQGFKLIIQKTAKTPRISPPPSIFSEVRRRICSAERTEQRSYFPKKAVFVASIVTVAAVLIFMPLMLNYNILHFGKEVDEGETLTMNVYLQAHINLSSEQHLPQNLEFMFASLNGYFVNSVAHNGKMTKDEPLNNELKSLLQYHLIGE